MAQQFQRNDTRINRAGRKSGVPNKTTKQLREAVQAFVENNLDDIQHQYNKLDTPNAKLSYLDKMLRYVLPSPVTELEQLSDEALDKLINKLKKKQHETTI